MPNACGHGFDPPEPVRLELVPYNAANTQLGTETQRFVKPLRPRADGINDLLGDLERGVEGVGGGEDTAKGCDNEGDDGEVDGVWGRGGGQHGPLLPPRSHPFSFINKSHYFSCPQVS